MVDAALSPPAPRGIKLASLYAFVGGATALALAGGVLAVGTVSGGSPSAVPHREHPVPTPARTRANDVGHSIPTSFGVVAARSVKKLTGLTPKALGGMTHFPSYVSPGQVQVQARVELSNLESHTVSYSPDQFRLVVGDGKPIRANHTNFAAGTLQPNASINGQLTFLTKRRTRTRAHLWLEFRDRGAAQPIRMDLGPARTLAPKAAPAAIADDNDHAHDDHPPPP